MTWSSYTVLNKDLGQYSIFHMKHYNTFLNLIFLNFNRRYSSKFNCFKR